LNFEKESVIITPD